MFLAERGCKLLFNTRGEYDILYKITEHSLLLTSVNIYCLLTVPPIQNAC